MRLKIEIEIEPRTGIFVPKPQEIIVHLRRMLISQIGNLQNSSSQRSLTAIFTTVHQMVSLKGEVCTDHTRSS